MEFGVWKVILEFCRKSLNFVIVSYVCVLACLGGD